MTHGGFFFVSSGVQILSCGRDAHLRSRSGIQLCCGYKIRYKLYLYEPQ